MNASTPPYRPHVSLMSALLLASALVSGCKPEGGPPDLPAPVAELPASHNLLLITWDTVRADRVYPSRPEITPTLRRLSEQGVSFELARTTSPLTLPAHASILTGLYPHHHQLRTNGVGALPASALTLAEQLQGAGWVTGAFVSAAVLQPVFGLNQGFHAYDYGGDKANSEPSRSGADTIAQAVAWLNKLPASRPVFMWVHLYDAHMPWQPPPELLKRFPHDPYAAEIAYVDGLTGRLLEAMKAKGRLEHTAVVLTADHGESLGEHGEQTHGYFAYDATMHVPLVFWAGAQAGMDLKAGARVQGPVSTVDISPTLTHWLGLSASATDGLDLSASLSSGAPAPKRVLALESAGPAFDYGTAPIFGVIDTTGDAWFDVPLRERYGADDPQQLRNVYAPPLVGQADALFSGFDRSWPPQVAGDVAPELTEQLAALGYVSVGTQLSASASYSTSQDPKERLPLASFATGLGADQPPLAALEQLNTFKAQYGELAALLRVEIALMQRLGRPAELTDALARSASLTGGEAAAARIRAEREAELTHKAALAARIEAAAQRAPDDADAVYDLGVVRYQLGDLQAALTQLRRCLSLRPNDLGARELAVEILSATGALDDAAALALEIAQAPPATTRLTCYAARLQLHTSATSAGINSLAQCAAQGGELTAQERALLATP